MTAPTVTDIAQLERVALRVWKRVAGPHTPCRVVVAVGSAGPSVTIEPALTAPQPDSPVASPVEVTAHAEKALAAQIRRRAEKAARHGNRV